MLLGNIEPDFANRIKGYIADRKNDFGFKHKGEEYRFYNLSRINVIHLKHKPRPEQIIPGIDTLLAELLKGEKIVHVEKRLNPGNTLNCVSIRKWPTSTSYPLY